MGILYYSYSQTDSLQKDRKRKRQMRRLGKIWALFIYFTGRAFTQSGRPHFKSFFFPQRQMLYCCTLALLPQHHSSNAIMSKNMKEWKMIKAAAGWKRRVQRPACIQILHSKYFQLISTEQDNMYNVWSCKSLLLKQKQSMKSWFRTKLLIGFQKQLYNTFHQQLKISSAERKFETITKTAKVPQWTNRPHVLLK